MWCVLWDRWVRHAAKGVHRCVTGQQPRCLHPGRLVWACTVGGVLLLWLLLRVFHASDGWMAGLTAVGDPTAVLVEVLEVAIDNLCDMQWSWRLRALVTVPAAMMGLGGTPRALLAPRVCLGLGVRWQEGVSGGNGTGSPTLPGTATHRFPVTCTPTMADVTLATSGSVELDWRDVPMRIDEHVLPRMVALRRRNGDRTLHVVSVYAVVTATLPSVAGSATHDVAIGVAAPLMAAIDVTSWSVTSWQVDPATMDAFGLGVTLHVPPSSGSGNFTSGARGAPWSLPDAWAPPAPSRESRHSVPVASQDVPYRVHLRPGAVQLTLPSLQLLLSSPRDTLACAPDAMCVAPQPDEHEPTWGALTVNVRWYHKGVQMTLLALHDSATHDRKRLLEVLSSVPAPIAIRVVQPADTTCVFRELSDGLILTPPSDVAAVPRRPDPTPSWPLWLHVEDQDDPMFDATRPALSWWSKGLRAAMFYWYGNDQEYKTYTLLQRKQTRPRRPAPDPARICDDIRVGHVGFAGLWPWRTLWPDLWQLASAPPIVDAHARVLLSRVLPKSSTDSVSVARIFVPWLVGNSVVSVHHVSADSKRMSVRLQLRHDVVWPGPATATLWARSFTVLATAADGERVMGRLRFAAHEAHRNHVDVSVTCQVDSLCQHVWAALLFPVAVRDDSDLESTRLFTDALRAPFATVTIRMDAAASASTHLADALLGHVSWSIPLPHLSRFWSRQVVATDINRPASSHWAAVFWAVCPTDRLRIMAHSEKAAMRMACHALFRGPSAASESTLLPWPGPIHVVGFPAMVWHIHVQGQHVATWRMQIEHHVQHVSVRMTAQLTLPPIGGHTEAHAAASSHFVSALAFGRACPVEIAAMWETNSEAAAAASTSASTRLRAVLPTDLSTSPANCSRPRMAPVDTASTAVPQLGLGLLAAGPILHLDALCVANPVTAAVVPDAPPSDTMAMSHVQSFRYSATTGLATAAAPAPALAPARSSSDNSGRHAPAVPLTASYSIASHTCRVVALRSVVTLTNPWSVPVLVRPEALHVRWRVPAQAMHRMRMVHARLCHASVTEGGPVADDVVGTFTDVVTESTFLPIPIVRSSVEHYRTVMRDRYPSAFRTRTWGAWLMSWVPWFAWVWYRDDDVAASIRLPADAEVAAPRGVAPPSSWVVLAPGTNMTVKFLPAAAAVLDVPLPWLLPAAQHASDALGATCLTCVTTCTAAARWVDLTFELPVSVLVSPASGSAAQPVRTVLRAALPAQATLETTDIPELMEPDGPGGAAWVVGDEGLWLAHAASVEP